MTRRPNCSSCLLAAMVAAVGIASTSCASAGSAAPALGTTPPEHMLLYVGAADGPMMSDVELFRVGTDGINYLGSTEEDGTALIPLPALNAPETHVLLACARYHYCGGFVVERLDLPNRFPFLLKLAPEASFPRGQGVMDYCVEVAEGGCDGDGESCHEELVEDRCDPASIGVLVRSQGGMYLPGAELFLVTSRGLESLGSTDAGGVSRLQVSRLGHPEAQLLLVCEENHFCGAFRLDDTRFFNSLGHLSVLAFQAIF